VESLGDSSIIAMTTFGSLLNHFPFFQSINDGSNNGYRNKQFGFTLGSDLPAVENKNKAKIRTMSRMMDFTEFDVVKTGKDSTSADYIDPQMLLNSNRVVINAKKDNIHISANKNMHLGSSRFLTISTGRDLIIESANVFFGERAAQRFYQTDADKRRDNPPEPMILGEQLFNILNDLIDTLATATFINPMGAPQLVFGGSGAPSLPGNIDKLTGGGLYKPMGYMPSSEVNPNPPNPFKSLEDIKNALDKIKSNYYFIEDNNEERKPMYR